MGSDHSVLLGCGDVGRRIVGQLLTPSSHDDCHHPARHVLAVAHSNLSKQKNAALGVKAVQLNLDETNCLPRQIQDSNLYYLVPPLKHGIEDKRSRRVIDLLNKHELRPKKVVAISTTAVYGDCQGNWIDEDSPLKPQTERGKRRLDLEQQWFRWCQDQQIEIVILRVPGIYAFSRIPRQRLEARVPVVRAEECGYTNRIHADDLAKVAICSMENNVSGEVINVTDGCPGKITDYLQEASAVLGLPPLPEISMLEAKSQLSDAMLSYLSESRKISNERMMSILKVALTYPDYRVGLRH